MGQKTPAEENEVKKQKNKRGADRLGRQWEQSGAKEADGGQVCIEGSAGSQESKGERLRPQMRTDRKTGEHYGTWEGKGKHRKTKVHL